MQGRLKELELYRSAKRWVGAQREKVTVRAGPEVEEVEKNDEGKKERKKDRSVRMRPTVRGLSPGVSVRLKNPTHFRADAILLYDEAKVEVTSPEKILGLKPSLEAGVDHGGEWGVGFRLSTDF